MTITQLLGINPLESSKVESKIRLNRGNTEGWLKTVAGFSNASGGIIYIGVEDKTGQSYFKFECKIEITATNMFHGYVDKPQAEKARKA